MRLTIEGEPKEIAALLSEAARRQGHDGWLPKTKEPTEESRLQEKLRMRSQTEALNAQMGAGERQGGSASPSEDLSEMVEALETMLDAARAALKPKFVPTDSDGNRYDGPCVWGIVQ